MAKKNTQNCIGYARTTLQTFDELPFNEVDSAILSQLCYLLIHEDFSNSYSQEGMPFMELLHAEWFDEMLKAVYAPDDILALLLAVACSPRYRGARVRFYRNENDLSISLQFSATVYSFPCGLNYIAYRGTDKTVHGWKEDCMLVMTAAAPCQMMAVNYLDAVGPRLEGTLIVGGHSKGGNIAVYAAAHCARAVQDRIQTVYSHDGPGFLPAELKHPGMQAIRSRLRKTIPRSSLVGLVLENETDPDYIESDQHGPMQHFLDSWLVEGAAFRRADSAAGMSRKAVERLNRWASTASDRQLTDFMNALFEIIEATNVDDLDELLRSPTRYLPIIGEHLLHADRSKRALIRQTLRLILTGKPAADSSDAPEESDIDWEHIDSVMNDYDIQRFNEDYSLFL